MPARLDSPFTYGLPAKIYWCLYLEPSNGYKLAKMVYGKSKNPPTAKIYQNLVSLKQRKFVFKDKTGIYRVSLEKLLSKLGDMIESNGKKFTESDEFFLNQILGSYTFKKIFEFWAPPSQLSKLPHDKINFVENLTTVLAFYALAALKYIKSSGDSNILGDIHRDLVKNFPDELIEKIEKPFTKKSTFKGLVTIMDYFSNDVGFNRSKKIWPKDTIDELKEAVDALNEWQTKIDQKFNVKPTKTKQFNQIHLLWLLLCCWIPKQTLEKIASLSYASNVIMSMYDIVKKISDVNNDFKSE